MEHVLLITMEEKEDHIEVGVFFDTLEKELGMNKDSSKEALVERKPLLPKKQTYQRSLTPKAAPQTNSIKIQRKIMFSDIAYPGHEGNNRFSRIIRVFGSAQRFHPVTGGLKQPLFDGRKRSHGC